MRTEKAIQTYSRAAYEAALEGWAKGLKAANQALVEADLVALLDEADRPFADKEKLMKEVLPPDISDEVRNFIFLLASKNDVDLLPNIIAEFERLIRRGSERRVAVVTTAVPLTEDEKEAMRSNLTARFGAGLDFDFQVDPDIIGGVIVRVGDRVIDGSVAGKLTSLQESLATAF